MSITILLILSTLTSFSLAYILIPVVIKTAHSKNLFDLPDARKQHTKPTPPLGGIAIFIALVCSVLLWVDGATMDLIRYPLVAMLVLFFVGLKDDLLEIKALKKLFIQIAMALVVCFGGIKIESLHGFLGIYELPVILQYVLSLIFVVGLTNAYNLIDGIDGLAGGIASIAGLCFAALFIAQGDYGFAICALALVGSLMGFLRYNFSPAKIFMGDTGSLSVGVLLSIMAVRLLQQGGSWNLTQFEAQWLPVWIFAIFSVPMIDITQVMIKRIIDRRSPFSPDRGHVHHMLQRAGFSHAQASIRLYGVSILNIAITFYCASQGWNSNAGFVIVLGTSLILLSMLSEMEKTQATPLALRKFKQVLIVIQNYLF
ncbi:MAG: MraY family glycosyltransferase [Bacteroidota bacterium]